jgi:type II secretory ATPase GspE/PulE/Tfp pilus assembly ATPase PilB-like protein
MSDALDKEIRLNQVYHQLDRKFEEEETQRQALKNQIPYMNLNGFPVDPAVLALVPKTKALAAQAGLFYREGRNLKLAILAPNSMVDEITKDLAAQSYFVEKYQVSMSSLKHLLESYGSVLAAEHHDMQVNINDGGHANIESLAHLSEELENISATDLLDAIMTPALALDSSDVHIEPEEQSVKIRYRIDGVLQDVANLGTQAHHPLVSRIKILSKLKLNVTTVPQDGSFHMTYNSNPVDVRVSVLPSAYGESIVMRILRQDKQQLKFDDLGIAGTALERLTREMEKPNGMVLTTGPTGSGKTTTLYAILNKMNEPGVKIITLEDPVEYRLTGITQTPIDAQAGMTFASGLRAILRQDPDVVMVGEMRDLETAETAAQAALTGHIVLSTLHTNDAPSAIPRLLDLGVKPFILAPAVNAIIAQRLVRRLCVKCKTEQKLDEHLAQRVKVVLETIPKSAKVELPKDLKFYHSPGCRECNGLGYQGRIGVYEIFTVTDEIEKLINKQATTSEIRSQAVADGMVTMAQDGLLKALTGVTDVEEVFRVTEG